MKGDIQYMRTIPILLRVVATPIMAGVVLFPAASGASAQESNAKLKPQVVHTNEADKAAGNVQTRDVSIWHNEQPSSVVRLVRRVASSADQSRQTAVFVKSEDAGGRRFPLDCQGWPQNIDKIWNRVDAFRDSLLQQIEKRALDKSRILVNGSLFLQILIIVIQIVCHFSRPRF